MSWKYVYLFLTREKYYNPIKYNLICLRERYVYDLNLQIASVYLLPYIKFISFAEIYSLNNFDDFLRRPLMHITAIFTRKLISKFYSFLTVKKYQVDFDIDCKFRTINK